MNHPRALLVARVAGFAREALQEEPGIWPRLGLVGPDDGGAHRDMDYDHFHRSALALESYFADMIRLGLSGSGVGARGSLEQAIATRVPEARALGLRAEATMLAATDGRNTHKGAIFLLGVLLLAWAEARARPGARLDVAGCLRAASRGFAPALRAELPQLRVDDSYGAWAWRRHGSAGARGLALAGFAPLRAVWDHAWALERRGAGSFAARLGSARLLAVALSDDTNLLKRAGWSTRQRLRGEVHGLWSRGGPLDARNHRELARLDAWVDRRGWSASASGDLLAAVLLLHKLCRAGLLWP